MRPKLKAGDIILVSKNKLKSMSIEEKAKVMVEAFIDDFKIIAIGGTVYKEKTGHPENMNMLMTTSEALKSRDILQKIGISMDRVDSGGKPQWEFKIFN